MKKHLLLLLFITSVSVNAQITFQKTFGGTDYDDGYSIQQTTDGGYMIAGKTKSFGGGDYDFYLIKLSNTGNTLWTKTFGGSTYEGIWSVQQTTDGGYIATGYTASFGAGGYFNVYLIKTDANGNSQWTKTFGAVAMYDWGNSVQQTADGGYIITGFTEFSVGGYDVYLIKTDSSGNPVWVKSFGGPNDDVGHSALQTRDGGYIIVGETASFGVGNVDIYLIKTDATGDTLWTKTYGGIDDDRAYSLQLTTDGGYVITGETYSFGAGYGDLYLIRTDSNGNLLWTKTFGGAFGDIGHSVQQTTDEGYIISGMTFSFGGDGNVYLVRTDGNGDSLWTKTFGGATAEYGYSVQQTTDGGYIIGGISDSFGAGLVDVYVIKTDSNGNSGCNESRIATIVTSPSTQVTNPPTIIISSNGFVSNPGTIVGSGGIENTLCTSVGINEITEENGFDIFPNPASGQCTIHNSQCTIEGIEIVNLLGAKIYSATQSKIKNQKSEMSVDISELTPGIYFVKVASQKGSGVKKLVVR